MDWPAIVLPVLLEFDVHRETDTPLSSPRPKSDPPTNTHHTSPPTHTHHTSPPSTTPIIKLVAAEGPSAPTMDDESFRNRSGSKGLRDFFRLRFKPTTETFQLNENSGKNSVEAGKETTNSLKPEPVLRHPKTNEIMETFRHRSLSASASDRQLKPQTTCPPGGDTSTSRSHQRALHASGYHRRRLNSECQNEAGSQNEAVKVTSSIGPEEFLEMYRHRANTEPNNKARLEAMSNIKMRRLNSNLLATVGPSLMTSSSSPMTSSSPVTSSPYNSLRRQHLIVWRDRQTGTQVFTLPNEDGVSKGIYGDNTDVVYSRLMQTTCCYDVIPNSSKIVILDSQLTVKHALYALIDNGIRSAPVWDHNKSNINGLLSVTDFIRVLHKSYHEANDDVNNLEEHTISTWRKLLSESCKALVSVSPDTSLFDAFTCLSVHKVHRVPVIDPSTLNILALITYKRLLTFLYTHLDSLVYPDFMNHSIEQLNVGTFHDVITVTELTPLMSALDLLLEHNVSALPVVDSAGRLVDVLSKSDSINLAIESMYSDLDLTVADSLNVYTQRNEVVCRCHKTDTLKAVIVNLVQHQVHRLVATDNEGRVEGIVSLSDVLQHVLMKPHDRVNHSVHIDAHTR